MTKDVTGTSRQRLYTHWCVTLRNSTVCMCMINCLNTGIHHIWDINGIYNVSKITECPVDSTPGNSRRQKSMEGVGGGIDSWSQLCDDDRTWSWLYFSLLLSCWERHFVRQCYEGRSISFEPGYLGLYFSAEKCCRPDLLTLISVL